ncbi:ABC transporter permease [Larkinella sp. VNQ87]|uniref:ABC transporter permease n=1 Tax=Larkinella sp. VNQ87 TaxID=3400921 RepID=UPI003C068936
MKPPRLADQLLEFFCSTHRLEEVQGDLHEEFAHQVRRVGERRARWRYWRDVLGFLKPPAGWPFASKRKSTEYSTTHVMKPIMIGNYFKIALRNLLRYKLNSSLNLVGLAIGLACGLLIVLHVKEELRYDQGFSKSDRIFRLTMEYRDEKTRRWAATSPILAVEMKQQVPGVQQITRFYRPGTSSRVFSHTPPAGAVAPDVKRFEEKNGFFADSTVTEVFDLSFVKGDPQTALNQPNTIVLTEATAKRYFGDQEPLGKQLHDDRDKNYLTVTGVVRDFGFPTHLKFDYLMSMATLYQSQGMRSSLNDRDWSGFYNYVLLADQAQPTVEAALREFMVHFYEVTGEKREQILKGRNLSLQPITDIHLHSRLEKEMGPNSDITYVYIFSAAALFILLVASVNFINMATAQAFNRMKEVGVRKALGARKTELINQFLGESFLLTVTATVLALLLFGLAIPFYNQLAGKNLQLTELLTPPNVLIMLALTVLISLLAGLYPAWFIANFDPVYSLKGRKNASSSVTFVRKGLIVFQFVVSVFMIFSTLVVYRQMQFFQRKNLGFDQEQLVSVRLYNQEMGEKANTIRNEWLKNSAITDLALISNLPGDRFSNEGVTPLGAQENSSTMRHLWSDENLLRTLRMSLKEGHDFTAQSLDAPPKFLLNQEAVKALKLEDPVGKRLIVRGDTGEVVGIVNDFNFASLHSVIEPLIIIQNPRETGHFLLKIKGDQIPDILESARATLTRISPESLFIHTFVDEKLALLYESEQRMSDVLKVFAVFGILISCLGLFGLSSYAAQIRTKEVGIRKVLGATIRGIVVLLSRDFVGLVVLAVGLASPLAWWVMNHWLQAFAYKIDIEWWMFALTGVMSVAVAVLTISFQSIKAALMNPVKSLRSE